MVDAQRVDVNGNPYSDERDLLALLPKLVKVMKTEGLRRVTMGRIEVEFGIPVITREPPKPKTPEEREQERKDIRRMKYAVELGISPDQISEGMLNQLP